MTLSERTPTGAPDPSPEQLARMVQENAAALTRRLVPTTYAEIAEKEFPPSVDIVRGIFTTGLSVLAGLHKGGKSWLVLDLAFAVAQGIPFLGRPTRQGAVLYMGLEDNQRRIQSRCRKQGQPATELVRLVTAESFRPGTMPPTVQTTLIPDLERYLSEFPDTALIIIDTWQRCKSPVKRGNPYEVDGALAAPLQLLAMSHQIGIILVTHVRKDSVSTDPFESVTGSYGLQAVADTLVKLDRKRDTNEATLIVTGRDVEDLELAITLSRDNCRWQSNGTAADRRMNEFLASPIRQTVLDLLQEQSTWQGTSTELFREVQERTHTAAPPSRIGDVLNGDFRELLYQVDRIEIRQSRKSEGRLYIFTKLCH